MRLDLALFASMLLSMGNIPAAQGFEDLEDCFKDFRYDIKVCDDECENCECSDDDCMQECLDCHTEAEKDAGDCLEFDCFNLTDTRHLKSISGPAFGGAHRRVLESVRPKTPGRRLETFEDCFESYLRDLKGCENNCDCGECDDNDEDFMECYTDCGKCTEEAFDEVWTCYNECGGTMPPPVSAPAS